MMKYDKNVKHDIPRPLYRVVKLDTEALINK